MHVIITDGAIEDLGRIVEFLAHTDPAMAVRVGQELVDAGLELENLAGRFRVVTTRRGVDYRRRNIRDWAIIYRIGADAVYIVRFAQGRVHPSKMHLEK